VEEEEKEEEQAGDREDEVRDVPLECWSCQGCQELARLGYWDSVAEAPLSPRARAGNLSPRVDCDLGDLPPASSPSGSPSSISLVFGWKSSAYLTTSTLCEWNLANVGLWPTDT